MSDLFIATVVSTSPVMVQEDGATNTVAVQYAPEGITWVMLLRVVCTIVEGQMTVLAVQIFVTLTYVAKTAAPSTTSADCWPSSLYHSGQAFVWSANTSNLLVYTFATGVWSILNMSSLLPAQISLGYLAGYIYAAPGYDLGGEIIVISPAGGSYFGASHVYTPADPPYPGPGAIDSAGRLWAFNPSSNRPQYINLETDATWYFQAPAPSAFGLTMGSDTSAILGPDGVFYILDATGKLATFNPATNVWSLKAARPIAIRGSAPVFAGDGRMYCFGGKRNDTSVITAAVYSYDPATNAWAAETNMPVARYCGSATIDSTGNNILLTGGSDASDTPITSTYLVGANAAPNAPALTYPVGGTYLDYTVAQAFTAQFSDPSPADHITALELHYRVGAGAWVTTNKQTTATCQWTFAANTFSAYNGQTIEWQMRTWDSADQVGPWSASAYAGVTVPPATSFVFNPAVGTLQSNSPTITGNRSTGTDPITSYRVRVVNDVAGAAGATVLADTGVVTPPAPVTSVSATLPVASPHYVTGTKYHVQAMIAYPAGVWQHAWTDSGAILANVVGPHVPVVVLTPTITPSPSVLVQITNPTPDPNPPIFNNVTRIDVATGEQVLIASHLALNGSVRDYGVGLNRPYQYRVDAVTADNTVTSSA